MKLDTCLSLKQCRQIHFSFTHVDQLDILLIGHYVG